MRLLNLLQSRLSIKITLLIGTLITVVILTFFVTRFYEQRAFLEKSLLTKGKLLTQALATSYVTTIETHNWDSMYRLVRELNDIDPEIVEVLVTDIDHVIQIASDKKLEGTDISQERRTQALEAQLKAQPLNDLLLKRYCFPLNIQENYRNPRLKPPVFDFAQIIQTDTGVPIAILRISLSKKALTQLAGQMGIETLFYIGIFTLLAFPVSFLFSSQLISRPIVELTHLVNEVAKGNLDKRISVKGRDEIAQLASNFNRMNEQLKQHQQSILEEKEKSVTADLIARSSSTLAHSIKNPLGIINGNIQQLQGAIVTQKWQMIEEVYETLSSEISRIYDTLEQLKEAAPKPVKFTTCQPTVVVDFALTRARSAKDLKSKIEVQKHYSSELPEILVDIQQLQFSLTDIIENAYQAMEDSGGTLTIALFALNGNGDKVCVKISDTGCGIPEKVQKKLFTPFFTTKKTGTGLGLWGAKRVVEEIHHGSLSLTSTEGEGTTVKIVLPAADTQTSRRIEL